MSLDSWDLSWRLRRLVRRAVCERFGHSWKFAADTFHCRACRITAQDAYYRRRRARGLTR
ncbi:MAG: hypothetical protein JOZ02_21185 [Acidobacteria bacterium]|nr:hypothetical protein [Acidobacteriota bacterium]